MRTLFRKIQEKTSVWTVVAFIACAVQIYRAAYVDALFFGIAMVLLHLESSGLLNTWKYNGLAINRYGAILFVSTSFLVLYLTKRQDNWLAIYFLVIAPLVLLTLWRNDSSPSELTSLEFSSAVFWSLLLVILALWELVALILAILVNNVATFPTLSELAAPVLDSPLPRKEFIALWLLSGYYIFRKWQRQ